MLYGFANTVDENATLNIEDALKLSSISNDLKLDFHLKGLRPGIQEIKVQSMWDSLVLWYPDVITYFSSNPLAGVYQRSNQQCEARIFHYAKHWFLEGSLVSK